MNKPDVYTLQEIWRNTPTYKRQELLQTLDITRQTWHNWRTDPAAMRLDQAIKVCNFYAIENPRDLVQPILK